MAQIFRVIRVLIMEGEEDWMQSTLDNCWVQEGQTRTTSHGTVKEIVRIMAKVDKFSEPPHG